MKKPWRKIRPHQGDKIKEAKYKNQKPKTKKTQKNQKIKPDPKESREFGKPQKIKTSEKIKKCERIKTSEIPEIIRTTSGLTFKNYFDHFLARFGYKRSQHRVKPGLYRLGTPDGNSKVFVTASYTLSFDALRSALAGIDGYILVLDTRGVNVWCAAGKRTFGTNELVHRIEVTALQKVVNHRVLILPQLGAPGVAAHEVGKRVPARRPGGHRVEPPVDEDPELGVLEPAGSAMGDELLAQMLPLGHAGTVSHPPIG